MQKPYVIFLTGASGAGKTTLINELNRALNDSTITYLHFDSIGVPSESEMIKQYGSPSGWQKAMTFEWVDKLTNEYKTTRLIILEGQVNLAFIVEAFKCAGLSQYEIILAHCDKSTRHKRLHEERNQPELVNDDMDNWSNFLFDQAGKMGATIFDTTTMTIDEMVEWFKQRIIKLNSERQ